MAADPAPYLLAEAAENLAVATQNLGGYIQRRAQEIAEPQIRAVEGDADARIAEVRAAAARQEQRHEGLIRELRRQLDAQVKANERLSREVKETREAVRRVEALRVWTNEDRKKFVFADELWAALAEAGSPAARELAALLAKRAGSAS